MKKLWLALFLCLGIVPAQAQTQCLVPPNAAATAVVSAATEGHHQLKASAGCLISAYVVSGASAGFLLILNSATNPVDGAVTPIECVPVAANSYAFLNLAPQPPEFYSAGIAAVYSTTGCLTKTESATAWFHALVQ